MTYKHAIFKKIACPVCGAEHEVFLDVDEECTRGLITCGRTPGRDWCSTTIAYAFSRGVTWTGQVEWQTQPSRFRIAKEGEGE